MNLKTLLQDGKCYIITDNIELSVKDLAYDNMDAQRGWFIDTRDKTITAYMPILVLVAHNNNWHKPEKQFTFEEVRGYVQHIYNEGTNEYDSIRLDTTIQKMGKPC